MMEFHISRSARNRYKFAETLFSFNGNVVFANIAASRRFAHRMNQMRGAERHPERAVHAAQLYAMGLIDEASHVMMARYRQQFDPNVMLDALSFFGAQVGKKELDRMLLAFVEQFPGSSVYRGEQTAAQWLAGSTGGTQHRADAFEEMVLLWMANRNPAFRPFEELFADSDLATRTAYRKVAQQLPAYFATRPLIPIEGAAPVNLYDLLRAPAVAAPSSLSEQLSVIRTRWKTLLGEGIERLLLAAGDILHEEELAIWMRFHPSDAEAEAAARSAAARAAEEAARRRREQGTQQWPGMGGGSDVPSFDAHEYESFSPDVHWMPTAVMIAKSTYVWLAQLSRKYSRDISRLDQIPDEDLDELARRGLNTLWLIGIWERSRASRTIKQLCGNRDAVASAYSLYDYRIAEDLGGEPAYISLRDRCYHRGIRLASDMVPNHMGIDSPWVVEHPEWFLSRFDSPYPAYDFNGPDLSSDPRVEIRIDRHYYEQTDAAVVFQRRDRQSGEVRYIYHGNDGTSFPWNDTAQLDYLNPAVREQLIQTILHVARLFPVIRFDAAMTLAKRHFQRLWFPHHGSGGAIPSRAESSMSTAEFNRHMPHEFWREVVDRVAAEVPGTLLLAEAFWLMEGYFVRTLGMHRVYNSAFMNMMRDEDNAKYRSVIKNTLEFDADIMKRYVNFMSNPDERTAIDQFGTGDKCFGVATLMATLPGLPMFGHGQIEGYTEKYGMEYRWPRYQEDSDPALVARHERQIAPLLHQRALFAESANFLLYDFYREDGTVDENVFAYSNRRGDQRALVIYNNRYSHTRGTLDTSAAYADKSSGHLRRRRLQEGLDVPADSALVLAWRDSLTGLHYLRRSVRLAEQGLSVELHAYQCHVFLEWRELRSTAEQPWDRLCDDLAGHGIADLEDALARLELRPTHDALRRLLEPELVRHAAEFAEPSFSAAGQAHPALSHPDRRKDFDSLREELLQNAGRRCREFVRAAQEFHRVHGGIGPPPQQAKEGLAGDPGRPGRFADPAAMEELFRQRLRVALRIPALEEMFPEAWPVAARRVLPSHSPLGPATSLWAPVLAWTALEVLAESVAEADEKSQVSSPNERGAGPGARTDVERWRTALDLFDRLRLREPMAHAFQAVGYNGEDPWRAAARIKVALMVEAGVLHGNHGGREGESVPPIHSPAFWQDADVRWLTGVHESGGRTYFNQEAYEELLWWLQLPRLCTLAAQPLIKEALRVSRAVAHAAEAAAVAGYRIDEITSVESAHKTDEQTEEQGNLEGKQLQK